MLATDAGFCKNREVDSAGCNFALDVPSESSHSNHSKQPPLLP